ncbi:helix-turn-helix transcriptional regulator [uncultured Draconibacterium sp.]|uniref:helix-turn-helix domain-containing protein n=1 Tax=uncultured Draconibacterium sp. TaxID=1573823 RepID=UPI0029C927F8|nr:helix-turn-helix transcriptional regulator [uncultured Draconibacterium sp.]
MIVKRFGEVLRDLRKQRGLSQEKLAELANMHDRHISFIERGLRKPSIVIVFQLAKALDIEASELILMVEKRLRQSEEE